MPRFGKGRRYGSKIQQNGFAKLFLTIFGNLDITSSHHHFIRATKYVKNKQDFRNVLDAGSGNGNYAFWVAETYPEAHIDACDCSEEAINSSKVVQGKLGLNNIRYIMEDLRNFRNEQAYDYIYSNHVLEHIPEHHLVLENLVFSLKPGGYIYTQMPDADQKRMEWGEKYIEEHKKWADKEHIGMTMNLEMLCERLRKIGRASCRERG